MDEWIEFEGRVAPMVWGKSTYTILPIPPDVIDQLALGGGKRVELEITDQSFELALTKAPVLAETFVYTGKRILTATAVTPGNCCLYGSEDQTQTKSTCPMMFALC